MTNRTPTISDTLHVLARAIIDGVTVDENQADSGRTTSAGASIHSPFLAAPPTHIPVVGTDPVGSVRTQLVIHDSPTLGTTKIHWWHGPDVTPPHDHPWSGQFEETGPQPIAFVSHILRGGYVEERYTPRADGTHERTERTFASGEINVMPSGVFHRVISVQPGTVTLMRASPRTADGKWYFYDPATNTTRDPDRDPNFIAALRVVNPHLRPAM